MTWGARLVRRDRKRGNGVGGLLGAALAVLVMLLAFSAAPGRAFAQSDTDTIDLIAVQGNQRVEPATIRTYLTVREGDTFARLGGDEFQVVVPGRITREDLARLAQPFEQIESQQSKTQQGSGLGLALSKALVEMHGGLLDLRSTPGQGTIASFSLPIKQARAALTPETV